MAAVHAAEAMLAVHAEAAMTLLHAQQRVRYVPHEHAA